MTVRERVDALVESLGALSPVGAVLAESARKLADDIDDPPLTVQGQRMSVAPMVNALRATVTELAAKGRVDDGSDAEDWADLAAEAGATPIRDAPESGSGNTRKRGSGGRKAAG